MSDDAPVRVLVVEDMAALREHIAECIRDLGPQMQVDQAADGHEALTRIDAGTAYRLVVSDIIMPNLDGEALLTELRRRRFDGAVMMLTALGQDDMIVRCLRLGACDYVVKPAGIDDIQTSVANALQQPPLNTDDLKIEYDPHGWFEVTAGTDPAVLFRYRRFLGLLSEFHLAEPAASEVRLALEELGRNAIEWGNRNDRAKQIVLGCRILPGKVIVYIEDEGTGFDPNAVPDPSSDPLGHIERRKNDGKRMGGYGIHLIKHLMDKVVWNARGNRVVAIKYLDRAAAAT